MEGEGNTQRRRIKEKKKENKHKSNDFTTIIGNNNKSLQIIN